MTFAVRNNDNGGPRKRLERLPSAVFIQRFMQHVLPPGLKRIRHYGLLAPCHRQRKLALCRLALGAPAPVAPVIEAIDAFMRRVAQIDITRCPVCASGHFQVIAAIEPCHARAVQTGPPPTGPPP